LKKHDNTRHLEKVMIRQFAIARYWEQFHRYDPKWVTTPNLIDRKRPLFDTLGNARKAYETVVLHDPTGPLADDALMALANSYFVQTRYEEAAEYYDRLRKEHPNSPHIMDAHLLLVKSKQLLYQGSLYDASPLKDADEAAEQTLRQFGVKLGEEQARLIDLRNKFEREMAERDWAMAQFYEGKKLYGSARIYYGYIMKDYPSTEMAKAAQERLEAIKDYPDKPPNHFKFLTDLFPESQ
ncbi:MAG TPA: hypothetical protein DD670_01330, partial [Planctomycetaceae bacterium]|nr:hypothetical protein [Planctomycetaceae bacterium]